MTAYEIRELASGIVKLVQETKPEDLGPLEKTLSANNTFMLMEIAAQLAELNESRKAEP